MPTAHFWVLPVISALVWLREFPNASVNISAQLIEHSDATRNDGEVGSGGISEVSHNGRRTEHTVSTPFPGFSMLI